MDKHNNNCRSLIVGGLSMHLMPTITCTCVCIFIMCVCMCEERFWGSKRGERKRERERERERRRTYTFTILMFMPTILPLQIFYWVSSCVTIHLSPSHHVGGVAVPHPLVEGSVLVGSLGAHCPQCSQSQGASLCTAHCTHCFNICRCIYVHTHTCAHCIISKYPTGVLTFCFTLNRLLYFQSFDQV